MSPTPPPEFLQPQWFASFFLCLWLIISAGVALGGGWFSLSKQFRSDGPVEGEHFRFASGSIGRWPFPVSSYGGCLFLTVNDQGLRLSVLFLFRFLSPPLFIPWAAVQSVDSSSFLFVRYALIRLARGWPAIAIRGSAGRYLVDVHKKMSHAP